MAAGRVASYEVSLCAGCSGDRCVCTSTICKETPNVYICDDIDDSIRAPLGSFSSQEAVRELFTKVFGLKGMLPEQPVLAGDSPGKSVHDACLAFQASSYGQVMYDWAGYTF